MQVLGRIDRKWIRLCQHYRYLQCDVLDSELTIPVPASPQHHPPGPVVLLIRINYSLNFADSKNGMLRPRVMVRINDTYFVQDSNWDWFEISDWDFATSTEFAHSFKQGQEFWDKRFMLIPASTCFEFDYDLIINDKVERWRPNILCRFELVGGPVSDPHDDLVKSKGQAPVHLEIDVIRSERPFLDRGFFRSDSGLYDAYHAERDARLLWHELGHAMDQDHIQALANQQIYHHPSPEMDEFLVQTLANGENTCTNNSAENGEDRCYVTPSWIDEANVMGKGKGVALENAKTWRRLINDHLIGQPRDFSVTTDISRPPRLISVRPNEPDPTLPKNEGPGFKDEMKKPL